MFSLALSLTLLAFGCAADFPLRFRRGVADKVLGVAAKIPVVAYAPKGGLSSGLLKQLGGAAAEGVATQGAARTAGASVVEALDLAGAESANRAPYDAHKWFRYLKEQYGPGKVSSSTVPETHLPGVRYANQAHPESGIGFDQRGFPMFDKIKKFDTIVPGEVTAKASRKADMRAATRNLRTALEEDPTLKSRFTAEQLEAISKGKPTIPELTWHHHQDANRMQLLERELHDKTKHVGGFSMWRAGAEKAAQSGPSLGLKALI